MSTIKNGLTVFIDQNVDDSNSSISSDEDERAPQPQGEELTEEELENLENIPERQGLLPPLPDINEENPVFTDDNNSSYGSHSRTQSLEKVLTPIHRSRTSSYNNRVTTPTSSIVSTPKADHNLRHHHHHTSSGFFNEGTITPGSSTMNVHSEQPNLATPVRERLMEEDLESSKLECSPTITIDERFEVKVEIPSEKSIPKTTEDKIKFFETFQKKEAEEFDKTLNSLKKGGWLSLKDLTSLENKKVNHFKKWEIKIKELKNTLRHKKQLQSTPTSSQTSGTGHDFSYFTPKSRDLMDNFEVEKSPNLQTLEQQFSVLGISHS